MNGTLVFVITLAVLGVAYYVRGLADYRVPKWLSGHPVQFHEDLVPEDIARELREIMKQRGVIYTNAADTNYYEPAYDNIGEAVPLVNDSCEDPMMMPNKNRTRCVLPGRIDVAKHYITSGGPDALKETYATAVSRLQSFGIYNFEVKDEAMKKLFASERFQEVARSTCPPDAQFVDPFQFNFITQIPGQTVAAHVDAPYFWGANRFQYPQWLLAVMLFSGLFQEKFVPQVQVVAYIHEWEMEDKSQAGTFLFWGSQDTKIKDTLVKGEVEVEAGMVYPKSRAGVAVDGSKLVHAANIYRGKSNPPFIDKSKNPHLRYNKKNDKWDLVVGDEVIESYTMNDLRISIVFRARCFANEEEAIRFKDQMYDVEKAMKLEDILSTLLTPMWGVGRIRPTALETDRRELAFRLIDNYVRYPYASDAVLPLNYCALGKLIPQLGPLLSYIC